MEPKYVVNWTKGDEYIVVSAEADDGTELTKKVFPLRLEAEAVTYYDKLLKARSLVGFTRCYAGDQKARKEREALVDSFFEAQRKSLENWIWNKKTDKEAE